MCRMVKNSDGLCFKTELWSTHTNDPHQNPNITSLLELLCFVAYFLVLFPDVKHKICFLILNFSIIKSNYSLVFILVFKSSDIPVPQVDCFTGQTCLVVSEMHWCQPIFSHLVSPWSWFITTTAMSHYSSPS